MPSEMRLVLHLPPKKSRATASASEARTSSAAGTGAGAAMSGGSSQRRSAAALARRQEELSAMDTHVFTNVALELSDGSWTMQHAGMESLLRVGDVLISHANTRVPTPPHTWHSARLGVYNGLMVQLP